MIDPHGGWNTDKFQNQQEFEDYVDWLEANCTVADLITSPKKEWYENKKALFLERFPHLVFPIPLPREPKQSNKESHSSPIRIKNQVLRRLKKQKEAHKQNKVGGYSRMHHRHNKSYV